MKLSHDCAVLVVGTSVPLKKLAPERLTARLVVLFARLEEVRAQGRPGLYAFLPGELELDEDAPLESATRLILGEVVAESRFEPTPFGLEDIAAARRRVETVSPRLWTELASTLGLPAGELPGVLRTFAFISTGDEGGNRGGVVFGSRRPISEPFAHESFAQADVYDTPPEHQIDGVVARGEDGSGALFESDEVFRMDTSRQTSSSLRAEVTYPDASFFLYSEYG